MTSTVPPKSPSIHSFSLPHLKWKKDGHKHRRRSGKSHSPRPSTPSASPLRNSPHRDSTDHGDDDLLEQSPIHGESSRRFPVREYMKQSQIDCGDSERQFLSHDSSLESQRLGKSRSSPIEKRRNQSRFSGFDSIRNGVGSSDSAQGKDKIEKKPKETEVDLAGTKKAKILIKIPCKNNTLEEEIPQENPSKTDSSNENGETHEAQKEGKINNNFDEEVKKWNLRPRKPISKSKKASVLGNPETHKAHSSLMNANSSGEKKGNCSGASVKKEKRKLSISVALSKEEIEEDIFAMTGSKPTKRPKKRAKNIQNKVDLVFPGSWLVSITPDTYKVSEKNSMKG